MDGAAELPAPAATWPLRRRELLPLWCGFWLLLVCLAPGNLETTDAVMTMHAARGLLLRGDSGMRLSAAAEPLDERVIASVIAAGGGRTFGKVGKDGTHAYVWFPIGHVWLMLPAVAVGERLAAAFPGLEARYRAFTAPGIGDAQLQAEIHSGATGHAAANYRDGHLVLDQGIVAMLLPPLFGATSLLLLLLLAQALGAGRRDALLTMLAIGFCTQLFPLFRETLSDGPGLCFLLAALLAVVRYHQGSGGSLALLGGGAAAGAAVLTRYQHGLLLPALLLAVWLAARRRGRQVQTLWFLLGGLPFAALLLLTNHARFGDPFDTGYPPAGSWFDYPPWLGLPKLLVAAGKGILWFSPLLWLAILLACRRRQPLQLRWLAWTLLLIPLLLFSCTTGWQSGQCWGARYVTPGVVALLALVLPQARPWQRWPKTFAALAALGVLVNVTSLLAPTHGHNQLAGQAVSAHYRQQFERGEIGADDLRAVQQDAADRFFFEWRYSPLHANWTYAWLSLNGRFGDDQLAPKHSAADTIEPLFGVSSSVPAETLAPVKWEDRGFRHLGIVFWGELLAVPWWLLLLPMAAAALVLLRLARRRLLGSGTMSAAAVPGSASAP